jgi:hypothetical protein
MSNASDTLAGLLVLNSKDLADINVTNLLQDAPLLQRLFAVPGSKGGIYHSYTVQDVAAGAEFRDVNTGILNVAGEDTQINVTCKYLDASFSRDVALADGYKTGRAGYMARETQRALKSMLAGLEKQILQGTTADADGFVGFPAWTYTDTAYDTTMGVNAGGSGGRSVWLVRTGVDDVALVAGNDGNINFDFDPEQLIREFTVASATPSAVRAYSALFANLGGWFGMQYGSKFSLGRIFNLSGATGSKLTDAYLSQAIVKFPAARPPNLIVMDRTSLGELQQSRTATNPTGAEAPFPADVFGIPIVVSDQLKTDETALTTTT